MGTHLCIGVKTALKPRFQPEAGNAPHCGSAASQEGGA